MAYDFTTVPRAYEYNCGLYTKEERMNEQMEYVRRPWKRTTCGGICVVCSTVKRPTELVDGTACFAKSVICLRCAIPPCQKCGDKAWAWKLLQAGFEPQHRMGLGKKRKQPSYGNWSRLVAEWSCRDLEGKPSIATPIRKDIKCRTKHLGAYCVSYVSKVSVGRDSARMVCSNMSRQILKCCVLCARVNVLAVGAGSLSER